MSKLCFPFALLLFTACPPSIRRPESAQLVVSGTLVAGGWSRRGEPLKDATITVRDASSGQSLASNSSSSAGGYVVTANVTSKQRVVIIAEAAGFAPLVRALSAAPYTEVTISGALSPLDAFECLDTRCGAPLVELEWIDPPMNAAGTATSFDAEPTLLVDVDDTHPAVLAVGFATLTGGASGTLLLRVPITSWANVIDATPGNGTIDAPGATFDPSTGKWTRVSALPLQSEGGFPLPESALGSIQRGEFAGGVVARLPVQPNVFLAVLGGPTAAGCVTGTVQAEGKKAAGATLSFKGFEPVSAGEDGTFCAVAPVSTQSAPLRGQYAGLPYSYGTKKRAALEGRCGGNCTELGELDVLPDALKLTAMCKFSGKVIDAQGTAIPNAEVVALDDNITGSITESFCGKNSARCGLTAPSAMDGTFTLNAPLLSGLFVGARATSSSTAGESLRSASTRLESCPNEPITLKLSRGVTRLELSVTFSGTQITWDPPRAASRIVVTDAVNGLPKWEIVSAVGLTPPVTFGTVPADATQLVAPTANPVSGDSAELELSGMGRDGVAFTGAGIATLP